MLTRRTRWTLAIAAAVVWSMLRATEGRVVNSGGWPTFAEFWTTIIRPEVTVEFLRLTADAALTTLALAILGTAFALVIGVLAAPAVSERVGPPILRRAVRAVLTVPRAVHEIIWALLLAQVFGFDAWVGVIAIGLPFGAITAKVFAETIDEADPSTYRRLRAGGGGRVAALAYGIVPGASGELLSFGFYRLECAIRSAAVLGVIGVGGLGFQLDLSFESLRYDEIWTLIAALMVLSGAADWLSTRVRRRGQRESQRNNSRRSQRNNSRRSQRGGQLGTQPSARRRARHGVVRRGSRRLPLLGPVVAVVASWWWLAPDAGLLVADRTRRRFVDTVGELFWPRLGPGGWSELLDATIDTIAMSVIALLIAAMVGLIAAMVAARPVGRIVDRRVGSLARGRLMRLVLLLLRAVPAPIWAFLFVLVLFPGPWPGAVALGVYNAGVLGRLFAEVIEERDPGPSDRLSALGASMVTRHVYGVLPAAAGRLISISLYRWEVIVRETVVVGVVGAGGLGQLINEHRAARDLAAVCGAIIAMIVLATLIDALSSRARRSLRSVRF